MQFTTFAFAAFAALASAAAIEKRSPLEQRAPIELCPALDTPQCCQADVDSLLGLTCSSRKPWHLRKKSPPKENPTDKIPPSATPDLDTVEDFIDDCAATGLSALCCTVPVVWISDLVNATRK
jgi:hypothetical protein